ncbi:ImmA/IrrE family metallo-endopeptidase [Dyella sedimenti]|uniref:ImmA/IrrE family metallo-endopeptidase n=1 Tax=Dyella sedimenti TaxID=2919947 RepID=UPI001FAAA793|nr:ImmA/IrrE family metallo-endopeptidase [Dyella sedimenti]
MDALRISPNVLSWAAAKAGESVESLAQLLVKRQKDRERIVSGELTFPQLQRLAQHIRVPVGFLFLDQPPAIANPPIPDLRQTVHADPLSADFFELLRDVEGKQDWFKDYLFDQGADARAFVGSFWLGGRPNLQLIAEDIRTHLRLTDIDRAKSRTPGAYFSLLAGRAEDIGILVMKSGIVRSNTKKPLSVAEFRGFALADRHAPVVFVNGRDAETAWCFTLAHELAHIWLGVSGVSDATHNPEGVEAACNKIAGELLARTDDVVRMWDETHSIDAMARYFRISRVATARRLFDLNKINRDQYLEVARLAVDVRKDEGGGGDPWATIPARNSRRFTKVIVGEAMNGNTMLRDAARLLNIKPDTVVALSREL